MNSLIKTIFLTTHDMSNKVYMVVILKPVGGGGDMHSGASSRSFVASAENTRNVVQLPNNRMPPELAAGGPPPNLENNGFFPDTRSVSPGSYGTNKLNVDVPKQYEI